MSKQTLFRQQKKIESLHKIAASIEGGRQNKFNYLKAHNPAIGRPFRGFPLEHGIGRFPMGDYRMLRRSKKTNH